MRRMYLWIGLAWMALSAAEAQESANSTLRLTLKEAIERAQVHSVDAAVALNELRTAYWELSLIHI